jgi:poly(3-hydroxybutyrate) depolymerase
MLKKNFEIRFHDRDIVLRKLVEVIGLAFCLNLDSIHMSGFSNGGVFAYYAIAKLRYSQYCFQIVT